jgi:hypothetical protein
LGQPVSGFSTHHELSGDHRNSITTSIKFGYNEKIPTDGQKLVANKTMGPRSHRAMKSKLSLSNSLPKKMYRFVVPHLKHYFLNIRTIRKFPAWLW